MQKSQKLATFGMIFGAIALLMAVVHFWAGPFTPKPPLEQVVADKVVAIRDATVAKLKGKEIAQPAPQDKAFDADKVLVIVTSVFGTIAIIFAAFAFSKKENIRACTSAVALGVAAIAFQFVMAALGLIVLVAIVASIFS